MNKTKKYETATITIISIAATDVIATSGAFNGKEDTISEW